jgi:hypothetical protein
MKDTFSQSVLSLAKIANQFDAAANILKKKILNSLSSRALPVGKNILPYHDLLLFLCAYPADKQLKQMAEKELKRIVLFGRKIRSTKNAFAENEGLPFSNTVTRFSPDFLSWLLLHTDLQVEFDTFYNPTLSLNDILNITLPATLKAETTAGLNNEDLLEVLHIQPRQYVPFILGQLEQLKAMPLLKELFIERMDLYVKLVPKNAGFSRANNRIEAKQVCYHQDLMKQFNAVQLMNEPLPKTSIPVEKERAQLCKVIKNSMALTVREIDPATFLQEDTMRLFELERGLIFAIYSMIPNRQLPLETYFGFTFFKNGIPVSYGGIWVFGKMGKIGVNIFEPFRGGESGYILCQLLRVLKQSLGVTYIEIEPYQFGLDNPGGITSGAFWFYYKYGFRPVDKTLKILAEKEHQKIKSKKNYRSSEKTLLRFTESNIGVNLAEKLPVNVMKVTGKILTVIKTDWHKNYESTRKHAVASFCSPLQIDPTKLSVIENNVMEDIAFWAMAMKVTKPEQLQLMKQMVFTKTKDDYAYQQLLLDFFNQ